MARLDAFSAQIVRFVREMPDEALLELVKQKLGVLAVSAAKRNGHRGPPGMEGAPLSTKAKGKRDPARRRRAAPPSPVRRERLDEVERIVKAGTGVSASEVAQSAGIPQTRAAAALKQLKLAKRIHQGGDRRFARYAGDAKTAEQASDAARKSAKGPVSVRSPTAGPPSMRSRKRPRPAASAPAA
jgi:hypothetical protein